MTDTLKELIEATQTEASEFATEQLQKAKEIKGRSKAAKKEKTELEASAQSSLWEVAQKTFELSDVVFEKIEESVNAALAFRGTTIEETPIGSDVYKVTYDILLKNHKVPLGKDKKLRYPRKGEDGYKAYNKAINRFKLLPWADKEKKEKVELSETEKQILQKFINRPALLLKKYFVAQGLDIHDGDSQKAKLKIAFLLESFKAVVEQNYSTEIAELIEREDAELEDADS